MKILCKYLGGSHSYGLNTPASDKDDKYVFNNTDPAFILGLEKCEFIDERNDEVDSFGSEIKHFIAGLRKSNTQAIETLFLPEEQFEVLDPLFKKLVIDNKHRLVDPAALYSCLRGYMQGELRLANGERAGKLGGKRKEQLEKYGFSPKNFVNLFRLAECGVRFFNSGDFGVNIAKTNEALSKTLIELKTNPAAFEKEKLQQFAMLVEAALEEAYVRNIERISKEFQFDVDYANQCLFDLYWDSLAKHRELKKCQT